MYQAYLKELEERFLRYVRIDTQSAEDSNETPSTSKQLDLLRLLESELEALGASDVALTDYGCVLATIPATAPADDAPTVAFLAHVDTAPAFSGANVKPIVHRNYTGEPIFLPDDPDRVLATENSPELGSKLGEDIVTASGTTLLGADDKAGVAIIMVVASQLLSDHTIPHGDIRVCFTPDEEVGRGVENLTLGDLAASVAYTLDGGSAGEITYETFSADKALVKIMGIPAHPGFAKGEMVNALHLAAKLVNRLPQSTRTPETTEGREGFIHLYRLSGTVAKAELYFILRDFELDGLKAHGDLLQTVCEALQMTEPRAKVECTITRQYRNMRYWLEKDTSPVDLAIEAIRQTGITPIINPIRGGTDGARLTERGLPTPNLFTGMQNFHSPLEWVSLQDMARATQVCLNLVQLWAVGK
ncbi:MAG: peptidase T [Chloroflexi bacterium]|nr:MAG: peptidase T [Chloroflexota bacterium]RLC78164.1 MAG: peptidase T [Chloroflexota bacterium]